MITSRRWKKDGIYKVFNEVQSKRDYMMWYLRGRSLSHGGKVSLRCRCINTFRVNIQNSTVVTGLGFRECPTVPMWVKEAVTSTVNGGCIECSLTVSSKASLKRPFRLLWRKALELPVLDIRILARRAFWKTEKPWKPKISPLTPPTRLNHKWLCTAQTFDANLISMHTKAHIRRVMSQRLFNV